MEKHVPTLKTCQRLKDAGFPQETAYWWSYPVEHPKLATLINEADRQPELDSEFVRCAAPLLTEILEQLPTTHEDEIFGYGDLCCHRSIQSGFQIGYMTVDDETGEYEGLHPIVTKRNPAEAAALLWLELNKKV